jgi:fluoride exporter
MLSLLVALAAGLGAVARYALDQVMTSRRRGGFPLGTFVVNVTGSFVFGLVTGLALHHGLGADVATVIGAGFVGGYTTFSTWAWECLALAETGAARTGAAYGVGSFVAGLTAAAAGLGLALL